MKIKILVACDDENVLELLGEILRTLGHTVLTAVDVTGAIEELEKRKDIELVLTDYCLPAIGDGVKILTVASAKCDKPGVPVVVMSGYLLGRGEMVALQQAGMAGFLQKPFTTETLMLAIQPYTKAA